MPFLPPAAFSPNGGSLFPAGFLPDGETAFAQICGDALNSRRGRAEIHAAVRGEPQLRAGCKSVLIRRQIIELPAVNFRLMPDAIFDISGGILPTRVFHAVGDDYEKHVFGAFGLRHGCQFLSQSVDRDADRIVQSGAAVAVIVLHQIVLKRRQIDALDDSFRPVGELIQVKNRFPGEFALFVQKLIEILPLHQNLWAKSGSGSSPSW